MRINDIGKHFMSAEFSKLAKTTKQVRESKLLEGTPGCADCEYMKDETDGMITTCDECAAEMNEAPTDQYSASNSRRLLVQLDNMQSEMEKIVNELYGSDNGDLQDQITTMDKYLKGFNAVIARAMKVVPNESIEEGRMSMRQLASMDKDKARKIEAMVGPESKYADMGDYQEALYRAAKKLGLVESEEELNEKGKGLWHNIHAKRKRGEKPAKPGEKGYPKTLDIESVQEATPTSEFDYDIKKFFAKVQELEDENQHGEVAKMLTQLYGTNAEAMIINGINAMHANEGSIGPEAQKLRDKISTKYYYQAQKEAMGEKFPANTSATQGKRMGAESIGERITAPVKPPKLTAPADISKPIKRPNTPKSGWAQVLDPVGSGKKKKKIGEARTNMFGIQVRDIEDKIKDTETQIELAKSNRGGWKEKDIPKLESKLAHLKMKKAKGVTEEAEKNAYVCVHAKKGKHECHATSSYGAAKKAAAHWGLKNTSGIDCHLAVEEGVPGMEPEQKICCKDCGDELYGEPKTDCPYDINNPDQDNWILVDVDGDGDPDMKIAMGSMPEGWMDDAKNAVGSTLGKVANKVTNDFKDRKRLFGKGKK